MWEIKELKDKMSFREWCALNGYAWDSLGRTFEARAKQYEAYLFDKEVKGDS